MKKQLLFGALCAALVLAAGRGASGLEPSYRELTERAKWAAARFDLQAPSAEDFPDRVEVRTNYAPVQKDNRYNRPMKMGEVLYTNGLYCHAPSVLDVKLSKSATRLRAVIGIDSNENTAAGGGSIQFIVRSGEEVFFKSDVFRGTGPGVPIDVALPGVREFTLEVSDGGDGFACDQADWADIAVELEDGTVVPLSSLELIQEKEDLTNQTEYPFEFTYGGRCSRDFLAEWKKTVADRTEGTKRFRTLTFDSPDGLRVVCDCVEYLDFPTVEWKLTFQNTGTEESQILEDIFPLAASFSREYFEAVGAEQFDPAFEPIKRFNRQGEFLLRHFKGGGYGLDDYTPLETPLGAGAERGFLSSGRPSGIDLPYFNLQAGVKGWIIVVGWSGQWKASFARSGGLSTRVTAAQANTHMKLLPGEDIRTPMIVVQNWNRPSWLEAQNVWRAWMMKYNVPRSGGEVLRPHVSGCSSYWYAEMARADEASQKMFIDRYAEEKIDLDYWWMDAGWYPCGDLWDNVGTWKPDPDRFPNGLRPITDYAHRLGIGSILWFEPERVCAGTQLAEEHADWLLRAEDTVKTNLLDLGNDQARNWLIDRIDSLIKSEGVDFYRQDFNMNPEEHWRRRDTPDRQGMTENRYVRGYLAFWDALLARNPGLKIDTCASGGNRNDLETLRRAIPLWRDDYLLDPTAYQNQTFGISLWMPLHGTGWRATDAYGARSAMVPCLNLRYDLRDRSLDYDAIRSYVKTWREVFVPLFTADFYPITPLLNKDRLSEEGVDYQQNIWIGWQYNDPKTGTGAIQMFRRVFSPYKVGTFPLYGLDPEALYTVSDYDSGRTAEFTGEELMTRGLDIEIGEAPGAVIVTYKKK